ncbi:MAG: hypothetical protein FP829_05515 [Nitrospirae bacterium]|nr:hypothetical protein [Nitrospirota bacterium]
MKKLVLVIAIAAIFVTGSMVYAGQFGPPEPAAKEGKVALGIGYFHYSAKSKPKDTVAGVVSTAGDTVNWDEGKGTSNQAYLQLGYGFTKNWEAYLRVGGADSKAKDAFYTGAYSAGFKSDFNDGYKPFGTIGVKGVFNVTPSFGIGPFFQATLSSSYKDSTSGTLEGYSVTQEVKVNNPREINLGVGLQGKIGDVIIYGGPVAYWAKHKAEWTGKVVGATWAVTGTDTLAFSTTYKEKNNIGGFAGVRVPLGKGLSLEVEGQMKSKFSMGGALTYSF